MRRASRAQVEASRDDVTWFLLAAILLVLLVGEDDHDASENLHEVDEQVHRVPAKRRVTLRHRTQNTNHITTDVTTQNEVTS